MISKKITLIGDFSTGKTSLIRRFVDNEFSDRYLSTIGVKISKKIINIEDIVMQGLIWDIEGGTDIKPINQIYLKGMNGCIIASDITREETLSHIKDYIEIVHNISKDIPFVIVLNKYDKMDEKKAQKIYSDLVVELNLPNDRIYLTSAKTGFGVDMVFTTLAKLLIYKV